MKTRIKYLLIFAIIPFLSFNGFAAEKLSALGQQKIDDFITLRMNGAKEFDSAEALTLVEAFDAEISSMGDQLSEEEMLILKNLIQLEKFTYLRYNKDQVQYIKKIMLAQKEQSEAYIAAHSGEPINKWLYVTLGDVTSGYMTFSFTEMIKYGTVVKDAYLKAVELDPNFSYALTNLAQWYYWAPGVYGGGKKKALEYFTQAVPAARTPAEIYFAKVYLSQLLFENKDKTTAAKLLDEAESITGPNKMINRIRANNKNGKSMFKASEDNVAKED